MIEKFLLMWNNSVTMRDKMCFFNINNYKRNKKKKLNIPKAVRKVI